MEKVTVVLGKRHDGGFGWAQEFFLAGDAKAEVQVSSWFMCLPGQGINYDKFILSMISLKDCPGLPPAHRRYAAAEFELIVVALNPEGNPDVKDPGSWWHMAPLNVEHQFHGVDRAQAARMADRLALACTEGRLLAETQAYVQFTDGRDAKMMFIREAVQAWEAAIGQMIEHDQTGGLHASAN